MCSPLGSDSGEKYLDFSRLNAPTALTVLCFTLTRCVSINLEIAPVELNGNTSVSEKAIIDYPLD